MVSGDWQKFIPGVDPGGIVASEFNPVCWPVTQKKRTSADEFLVEKKNPLILPPDYGDLPSPENNKTKVKSGEANEIQNLLNKDVTTAKKSTQTNGTSSVENSILKKIKDK